MSNSTEFDSTLGGTQELPESINILKFSAARYKEIETIKNSLSHNKATKLAFQKLPKHMRRRVMSHNAKRLPRRLREIHLGQLKKSGMPPRQKRPSRKYRRRPGNLQIEFARRQNRARWLETHVWHAKRFHMIDKWGYRLPDRPCDKSFRACYRASAQHCLIQDISYISCIELQGKKTDLIEKLKTVCKNDGGLSIGARAYTKGDREGTATFYTCSGNPIGTVTFNWKGDNEDFDSVWIWIHAAFYPRVLSELISLFSLEENGAIKLIELKDELNRFRLSGPLSHAVLWQVLKPIDHNNESEWFKNYLLNDDLRQGFSEQITSWEAIQKFASPANLAPGIILSMIVTDPRFTFPKKRTKAVIESNERSGEGNGTIPPNMHLGAIWNDSIRKKVKEEKISNAEIAELQSANLIPGTELTIAGQPVPIMLIQQRGIQQSGYNSGWDIIIPSGWAQPFWMCMIMWGARAGGLRESDSVAFESGLSTTPPDTEAGEFEENEITKKALDVFFKKPPNKRINYNKFRIVSPCKFNWKTLINDWSKKDKKEDLKFSVLRNIQLLKALQDALKNYKALITLDTFKLNDEYLVPVRLSAEKGLFKQFAIICLPTKDDYLKKSAPVEPKLNDKNQEKRKELRRSHKTLLKRLKRKRHLARQEGQKIEIDRDMLMSYQKTMRELWIPSKVENIRNSCSREVMGFVTKGDFSFVEAKCRAIGYVTAGALNTLFEFFRENKGKFCKNKVLIRNTNSRQYRFATLEIIE